MTNDEYFKRLREDVFTKDPILDKDGVPDDVIRYFDGHFPRFEAQLDMIRANCGEVSRVLDIGTGVPFVSYWFNLVHGAEVIYGMPVDYFRLKINDRVSFTPINVNYHPELPTAGVVICTECLEHLPSSMTRARDWLAGLVEPGGFFLLSFPLGGSNAQDYEAEDLASYDEPYHRHFREFTRETAEEFLKPIPFDIVDDRMTWTRAYGNDIWNVLLKRRGE